MTTDKKLYVAVAVLAALGGAVYLQNKKAEEDARAHSIAASADALPKVQLTEEQIQTIDRIELLKPAEGDGGAATQIVLVKKGEEAWDLEQPAQAKANASNVKSLLDSLKRLEVSEEIATSKDAWGKFGVTDEKAIHAVFKKGGETLLDLRFGESGSRGQMTRIADKESVYAIKGYSSFLYNRDASGWRDKKIFEFEEKDAVKVTVQNENGEFVFDKAGEAWAGKHTPAKKGSKAKEIDKFDPATVDNLVRAYKSLNASEFGDGKQPADVGLAEPVATVTIDLKDGTGKHVLKVGSTAEGTNRWVMRNGSDQIFTVTSWTADWATANGEKFQTKDDAKGDAPPDDGEMPAFQMPGMPGMHDHG
jgi:hypothetical protein